MFSEGSFRCCFLADTYYSGGKDPAIVSKNVDINAVAQKVSITDNDALAENSSILGLT